MVAGTPRHAVVRRLIESEVREQGASLALTPQVVHEFLHVATDPKRFAIPLPMEDAIRRISILWDADEVVRIPFSPDVLPRTLELLKEFKLGRKRILDTALAASLELAGVRRLVTFNRKDFSIFSFLEIVGLPEDHES